MIVEIFEQIVYLTIVYYRDCYFAIFIVQVVQIVVLLSDKNN